MPDDGHDARLDRTLIARVLLNDDRHAFEQLLRRHQGMVRAQLRRLVPGDPALADDLAQETFLLAWRKLDQFRADARFSTWLHRIAYTCFIDAQRKRAWPPAGMEDAGLAPSPAPASDLKVDVARAMLRLSSAERAVLLHNVQLGLSHEDVAYVLGMPLGTVKSHVLRGKAKLRELLAPWGADVAREKSA